MNAVVRNWKFTTVACLSLGYVITAEAALLGRDIAGTPVEASSPLSVFLYDTDLNITWLQNASVGGRSTWFDKFTEVDNLVVGAFSDWRLPSAFDQGQNTICTGTNCVNSELGHLWYIELGNVAGATTINTGAFRNFQTGATTSFPSYWTSTLFTNNSFAYRFGTQSGVQDAQLGAAGYFAIAVRSGDVAVVPELSSSVSLLSGLAILSILLRRKQRQSTDIDRQVP